MKNRLAWILFLPLLNGCHSMYTPLNYSPTSFTEGNDLHVSLSMKDQGTNGFLAYTPIKHLFIYGEANSVASGSHHEKHKSYSYGIGGYHVIKEKIHLEIRCGYGEGNFKYYDGISGSSGYLTYGKGNYYRAYGAFSILYQSSIHSFGLFANVGNLRNNYTETNLGSLIPSNFTLISLYSGLIYKKKLSEEFNLILSLGVNIPYYNGGISDQIFRVNQLYSNIGITFNLKDFLKNRE